MNTANPTAHAFDQAMHLQPLGDDRFSGHTSEAYANMVGPFGGATAAVLLNAVLQHPQLIGEPVSLTVNFAAALQPGPFEIEARPLRSNRSTQHWLLLQYQNSELVSSGTAFTAIRRSSWSEQELACPAVTPADSLPALDAQGMLRWISQYDLRFVCGGFDPHSQQPLDNSLTRLWVRDEPPRPVDFLSLAAIGDCFFPRIFTRRQRFVPAGTVSLTHHFHVDSERLAQVGSAHLLGQAQANRGHNNYMDQSAHFWSADGELLLSSSQTVYFKE